MAIKISSGKYNVIGNGMVLADSWTSDITFEITTCEKFSFSVVLKFIENGNEKFDTKIDIIDDKVIVMSCIDFKDTTGTNVPMELATVGGKKIFFNFRNYQSKKVMRKIEYTFYQEK